METNVFGCVHRRGKPKYRITKVGVKSKIKVKVKNDHRSKFSNLSNWKEEA